MIEENHTTKIHFSRMKILVYLCGRLTYNRIDTARVFVLLSCTTLKEEAVVIDVQEYPSG
jgi:hypothetical protein